MTDLTTINPGAVTFGVPTALDVGQVGDDPPTNIVFGITFDINGTQVPISTEDIADARAKGIDLGLPGPVVIGSIDDFTAWFKRQFGIDLPRPEDFPPPLNDIFAKLTSLVWTVNAAHINIPGTDRPGPKLFTLTVTAAWPQGQGIPIIPGVLTIDGAVFGVSNEKPKTPSE
jgi:hypothetical protein